MFGSRHLKGVGKVLTTIPILLLSVVLLAISPMAGVPVLGGVAAAATAGPEDDELLAEGKVLFEETAGDIGCATCHGIDGRTGEIAPPNAGADEMAIRNALGAVVEMQSIKLTPHEIEALVAYVQYLGEQPVPASLVVGEASETESADQAADDLLAQGKQIFEETAGGIGCAACHGMDGRSGEIGPPNAGADEAKVQNALKSVPEMASIIKLSHSEVKAVVAYLKYLGEQPAETVVAEKEGAETTPASPETDQQLAQGKKIFEETAGGIGCAACHGMDGRSGEIGPPNAGADEAKVRKALQSVPDMASIIKLTHSEIKAVVAYLQYLGEQPAETVVAEKEGAETTPASPETDQQLAQGKQIFEETAGGIGCAACHGIDGRSGEIGPPNAGADEAKVRKALQSVPEMSSIIKLSHSEIKAVVAYLQYLGDHPN